MPKTKDTWNATLMIEGEEQVFGFYAADEADAWDAEKCIAAETGGIVQEVFENVTLADAEYMPQ
jgi:hypothetical protein